MSKHKRKRFLSILITAVLVFTLALSSVMAQDDEHVRTDKLSVEGESVEVIEGVVTEDVEEVGAEEAIIADDAEAEEADADEAAETEEELPAGEVTEEADADVPDAAEDDAEADAGIMTLSAGDAGDEDDYGIRTLADTITIYIGDGGDYSTFEDAISATTGSYDEIKIVLSSDVSEGVGNNTSGTDGYIPFEESITYTLDFNGHTINGNKNTHMKVFSGATLILTDSVGGGGIDKAQDDGSSGGAIIVNGTLIMESGAITNGGTGKSGGAVSVESGGTFEMSGGTISGNTATNNGGGVYVDAGGSFTMSGNAIITDNSISGNYGGAGVAIIGSSSTVGTTVFTMNGGTISENKCGTNAQGAGIYSEYATLNLNAGEISGNTTTNKSGGGVYAYTNSVVTMEDGMTITDNHVTANDAGGVIVYDSTFTMNGGTISNNTANSSGGVQVYGGSTVFNMNGGEITGNTADANKGSSNTDGEGGGVQVKVSGSSCTFNMTGGTISGNTAARAGGGIGFASGTVNIGGTAKVTGNTTTDGTTDNVHLYSGSTITLLGDDDAMSDGASIGVNTVTKPTENSAVQITSTESGTELYAGALQYFSSDDLNYKVRTNDSGYLELYLFTFEADYLSDDNNSTLYTSATADNYAQILSGKDAWDALTDEEKALVNADLTAAYGSDLTYEDLLAQAQAIADEVNAFENSYLGGADSLYTEATADNYMDILAGASDWADMSDEAKAAVNADLTAAYGSDLTYDDLLAQAFELAYLTDDSGNGPYTEVTADNMDQILSGADDWANMSDAAKAAVNAALQEASGDSSLTYEDLLADAFQQKYLTDGDGNGPYTEATLDNYDQILAGADDWDAMSDEAKAAVNAALTEANGGVSLTYEDLLAQAQAFSAAADFIYSYVSDSDPDNPYLEATADNYAQILSGEDAWNAMSEAEQAAVNAALTEANGGVELTYPMLLAQAKAMDFEEKYLTDENGNGPYTAATAANMDQILAGADDWNAMSDEEKAAVNAALTEANGGVELTYDELLAQAFMLKYLTDEDGNLYTGVNADNYLKILSGADDWNRLSPEAQALVNMYLTAAWQAAGNEGELTYPMLLEQAEAFAASLGNVKTGDSTHLYLYVILAAAAAAAAAGVAVSRRRRV